MSICKSYVTITLLLLLPCGQAGQIADYRADAGQVPTGADANSRPCHTGGLSTLGHGHVMRSAAEYAWLLYSLDHSPGRLFFCVWLLGCWSDMPSKHESKDFK